MPQTKATPTKETPAKETPATAIPATAISGDPTRRHVRLKPGYDIIIGQGLLERADIAIGDGSSPLFIVTDDHVAPLWREKIQAILATRQRQAHWHIVPHGEASKNTDQALAIVHRMLDHGVQRTSCLIAIGGGVIGDLAGFAASLVLRGIDLIHVPTTLLAQVDSAIGGKTGVNTSHGKNLVGTFYQPQCVVCDMDFLHTLPELELRSGYGEIIKYALINDPDFFAWLDDHAVGMIAGDDALRRFAIARCCDAKALIVEEDEKESGRRALLNLGHTFAHALEAAFGYKNRITHGQAVAIGLVGAFALSETLGHCPSGQALLVERHLRMVGLPVRISDIAGPHPSAKELQSFMAADKKSHRGDLRMILVRGIGQAFIASNIPTDAIENTWHGLLSPDPFSPDLLSPSLSSPGKK